MLQGESLDLVEAVEESKVVIHVLQEERDDEVWEELYERAKEMAAEWGFVPSTPRRAASQRHRINVQANTPMLCWRRAVYLPLVDYLVQWLNDRSRKHRYRFLGQSYSRKAGFTRQSQD
ncbi:predicted protein [Nematostella vectensis]|uniref:Uncharacterized protein n=1 Tax=Nematostella vectensis TaxID=45351 RepID=A7T0L6_NEMVE|nr:predicted protein [Nematostella vectensis]|eukprot:XP_001622608.1 hypothetical protein NEMVEDRAFT_v1g220487 [Nematostella vectensis]